MMIWSRASAERNPISVNQKIHTMQFRAKALMMPLVQTDRMRERKPVDEKMKGRKRCIKELKNEWNK